MRFKFHAKQTSVHSFWTFAKPRSRNWRKPITDLMMIYGAKGHCDTREISCL